MQLRPFDEIPDAAEIHVRRNQAMTWLQGANGIQYQAPKWLAHVLECAWHHGKLEAQADMRAALGFQELVAAEVTVAKGEEVATSGG